MGAEFAGERVTALAVSPSQKLFGKKLNSYRRAIARGQLTGEQSGNPIAAEQAAHWSAGSRLRQEIILFFGQHFVTSRNSAVAKMIFLQRCTPLASSWL